MCDEDVDSFKPKQKSLKYSLIVWAESPDVQQVRAGGCSGASNPEWRHEPRLCRDLCWCGAALCKNVLNAIVEDGEATVLGLRRSKPLFFFFRWEGAFLIQNSSTKDFQWALPHPHLTWGHSSAFQAYQWHVPIRAPIKSAPFPWNISKHFDGSGFPPAGFLESLSPPTLFFPPSFPPLPPLLCQYHPSFGWTSDPHRLPWRAVVTETQSKTKEELLRRGNVP